MSLGAWLLRARGFTVDSVALPMNGEKSRFNHTLHSDFQIGFEKKNK